MAGGIMPLKSGKAEAAVERAACAMYALQNKASLPSQFYASEICEHTILDSLHHGESGHRFHNRHSSRQDARVVSALRCQGARTAVVLSGLLRLRNGGHRLERDSV